MLSPKGYLSWLDSEIEKGYADIKAEKRWGGDPFLEGKLEAYITAKKKFLTIQFPSQLTDIEINENERSFTDGLE